MWAELPSNWDCSPAMAVESYIDQSEGGRKRKYYHLTEKGKKLLAEETQRWRTYEHAINAVLSMG